MSDETDADLSAFADLLADSSLWEEPPAGLEDRIVAAIAAEATGGGASPAPVVRRTDRRVRRSRLAVPFLVGAAAASLAFGAVLVATRHSSPSSDATVAMAPGPAAPSGVEAGVVKLRVTASGLRIELDATSLPALPDGGAYACWVKTADGLHTCGAFHTGGKDIVLWSSVRNLADVQAISITLEPPGDTDPASSGQRVLFGQLPHG